MDEPTKPQEESTQVARRPRPVRPSRPRWDIPPELASAASCRLTPTQRERALQLYASGYGYRTTAKKIAAEFDIDQPSEASIRNHVRKRADRVEHYRAIFSRSIDQIAIANKHYRLRVLDEELRKARHDRQVGETKSGAPILKRDFGAIVALTRLAAEETGGLKTQQADTGPIQIVVGVKLEYPGMPNAPR